MPKRSKNLQSSETNEPPMQPGQMMRAYIDAFEARDAERVKDLVDEMTLVEIPLLKPNRLFGATEIYRGHEAVFSTIDAFGFELADSIVENDKAAIAMGALHVTRRDGSRDDHEIGLVVEIAAQSLRRISLYLNSRNFRRWADETIV